MDEKRPARHGFGHREYAIWFDGLTGEFTNLPCYAFSAAGRPVLMRPNSRDGVKRMTSRGAGNTPAPRFDERKNPE